MIDGMTEGMIASNGLTGGIVVAFVAVIVTILGIVDLLQRKNVGIAMNLVTLQEIAQDVVELTTRMIAGNDLRVDLLVVRVAAVAVEVVEEVEVEADERTKKTTRKMTNGIEVETRTKTKKDDKVKDDSGKELERNGGEHAQQEGHEPKEDNNPPPEAPEGDNHDAPKEDL